MTLEGEREIQRCRESGEVINGDSSSSEDPVLIAVKVAAVIIIGGVWWPRCSPEPD